MDQRRRWVLTNLRTFINLLDEEKPNHKSATKNYRYIENLGNGFREKYPTCPAMARTCRKKPKLPFEYTLRSHTSVPYYEKKPRKCISIHVCSPSTTLHFKPVNFEDNCELNDYKNYSRSSIYPRNIMNPCKSRNSQEIYKIGKNVFFDIQSEKSKRKMNSQTGLFGRPFRPSRRLQKHRTALPKLCQSRELRGGFLYQGCDCDKTNGLQDRCLRFCCLENPKCRTQPAACYLSRYSGGKHLPNKSTRPKTAPTDINFYEHYSQYPVFTYMDTEDQQLYDKVRQPRIYANHEKTANFRKNPCFCENMKFIDLRKTHLHSNDSKSEKRNYPPCVRNTNVVKPYVNSTRECSRCKPLCVFCPINYIKSFNVLCTQ